MINTNPYTKFWNDLNELGSPGYGTILATHHHEAVYEDDYAWTGMALYSASKAYRYVVTRVWDKELPLFGAVLLNPSTATEYAADPTVTRVIERARRAGIYGGFVLMNIFAYRATDPKVMRAQADPIGRENNVVMAKLLPHCAKVLCGWGAHGKFVKRGEHVEALIRGLQIVPHVLALTKDGYPAHPLYQPYAKPMKPWSEKK